jgi:hypothetical protein
MIDDQTLLDDRRDGSATCLFRNVLLLYWRIGGLQALRIGLFDLRNLPQRRPTFLPVASGKFAPDTAVDGASLGAQPPARL